LSDFLFGPRWLVKARAAQVRVAEQVENTRLYGMPGIEQRLVAVAQTLGGMQILRWQGHHRQSAMHLHHPFGLEQRVIDDQARLAVGKPNGLETRSGIENGCPDRSAKRLNPGTTPCAA
jgi:hypothetical protein